MRVFRGSSLRFGLAMAVVVISALGAIAKPVPQDPCTLLPASELQSILGQAFGKPASTVAPAAYANLPTGTDCTYTSDQNGGGTVLFRIYSDPSPAVAKDAFAKLSLFYPAKSKPPNLGDSAYIDVSEAIHVLKGNVRFYISVKPATKDRQLIDLAGWVVKQL
ncbi:MAG: hypothetical protein JO219_08100 [Candidatus Eremiobacteraeota bacterium]|nr:hypothetical protein [Candidatus Eremiobacteraeota bacterium]MBV8367235.1 hypothetical protein [Candidatus Eremiobacteraeota bacterium]